MIRPHKVKQIEALKEKVANAKSFFLTDYTGLNVLDLTRLRRELQKNGGEFKVAKNTLIRLALEDTQYSGVAEYLVGQTGLGFGYDDPSLPAKVLHDFFKRIEKPKVRIFYLEGRQYPGTQLSTIAALPSKEQLLAQVVGNIQGPLINLVSTLDLMLSGLVTSIDQIKEKKEREQ
jgi:large subunit ribosomal protein L10